MDYELTQRYYTDAKQKYEKKGDQIEYENWQKRVKDSAGNWNQNPHDRDTVYPKIAYWRLARIKGKDGKEYLETRSMWTGVNAYGDEQTTSMVDPELFTETKWNSRRIQDPNDRNNIITEASGVLSQIAKHKPESLFNPERARECYGQPHDNICYLVVRDDTRDAQPIEVSSIEDFTMKSFNDLAYGTKSTTTTSSTTKAK
jgi:hypothetical protein